MAAQHHNAYSVMTSSGPYSHSGSLLDGTAMNVDLDSSAHRFNHVSPPSSSGSNHSSMMYGANHVDFSSTPGAVSFSHQAPYTDNQHHSPPHYPNGRDHPMTLNPAQLRNTAVGPSRVLTRRQARAAQHQASAQSGAGDNVANNTLVQEQHFDDGFGMYPGAADPSRPQTPNRFRAETQFSEQHQVMQDLGIASMPLNVHHAAMSPPHPSTPASVTSSSGISHYGFHPYATHSRSTSSSTHPRSASPAISVLSAATSMSSNSGRPRPPLSSSSITSFNSAAAKPKRRLVNKDRKAICMFYAQNPNARQEDIAARWGVERSTVSKILKHKSKWLAIPEGDDQQVAKHRPSKFPEIEAALAEWLIECRAKRQLIQDVMIRLRAKDVAREMGISDEKFKASAGWVENFKHRHGIKKGVWIGRNGGAEPPLILDDESESDGETLSELRERQEREFALRAVAEKELAEQEEQALSLQNGQTTMDIAVPASNPGTGTATSEPKAPTEPTNPPMPTPRGDAGMMFTDSSNAAAPPNNDSANSTQPLTHWTEDHRQDVAQQIAMDMQPPPPYQSNLAQNGVSSQDASALSAQGVTHIGDMLHYQTHSAQSQPHTQINYGQAWTVNPQGVVQAPVSAQEANAALEKVILFLKAQRPGFLTPQEQNTITDVKHIIWVSSMTPISSSPTTHDINAPMNQTHSMPGPKAS